MQKTPSKIFHCRYFSLMAEVWKLLNSFLTRLQRVDFGSFYNFGKIIKRRTVNLSSSSLCACFQVAQEIWVCEKQTITKWQGDILAYKEHLKSKLVDEDPQLTKKTHNV